MKQIDTRGLSCPQPVIMVMDEIKKGSEKFEILLDSTASCENVKRVLNKNKLSFQTLENSEATVYVVQR